MRLSEWSRGAAVVSLVLFARVGAAADEGGGLLGWVEDTRGAPLSNAVISVFGRGLAGGGVVTMSDSAGRFFVPSLPAGSYTLRALREGHVPAPARHVTVLPHRDATFTLSLAPVGEPDKAKPAETAVTVPDAVSQDAARELRWLIRHKRRSVLEEHDADYASAGTEKPAAPSGLADLGATVQVMTNPASVAMGQPPLGIESRPASLSAVRLNGRLTESGRWSLGGLIAESEGTAWRMAAEFVFEPGDGHHVEAGSGYGTGFVRTAREADERLDGRNLGAVFAQDRWQLTDSVRANLGARYSYIGFLADANHLDPTLGFEVQPQPNVRFTGGISRRTVVPGGDLLTLSTLTAPAIAFALMDAGLRPEGTTRFEVGLEESHGPLTFRAQTFYEDVRDQLANVYSGPAPLRSLRIENVGQTRSRGMVLTIGRRFGDALSGSVSYTLGHTWRPDPAGELETRVLGPSLSASRADYHDVAARMEAFIDDSDTRVVAFYRFNALTPTGESHAAPLMNTRFDVQVSQGLPFLGHMTGADWDLLLAVRNLYYETSEGAALDELAVLNPPKRLLGGISVRF